MSSPKFEVSAHNELRTVTCRASDLGNGYLEFEGISIALSVECSTFEGVAVSHFRSLCVRHAIQIIEITTH